MEYHQEIIQFIAQNEPITSTDLARHFKWSNLTRRRWVEALRKWEWIVPKGKISLTAKGKENLDNSSEIC